MTRLHKVVYVVCRPKSLVGDKSSIVKMYTADTLSPLGEDIHIEGMRDPGDIVHDRDDRQLYVSDWNDNCIWRVSVDDHSYVRWLPTESTTDTFIVCSLSLRSRRLLVTTRRCTLHQYNTTDRQLLRIVQMPEYVELLYHGVETTRGTFVVSHQRLSDEQYAVSELFNFCLHRVPKLATPLASNTLNSV